MNFKNHFKNPDIPDIIIGIKGIAAFYHCSSRTVQRRLKKMQNAGVIFRRWVGRPPIKVWTARPEKLMEYEPLFWDQGSPGLPVRSSPAN